MSVKPPRRGKLLLAQVTFDTQSSGLTGTAFGKLGGTFGRSLDYLTQQRAFVIRRDKSRLDLYEFEIGMKLYIY